MRIKKKAQAGPVSYIFMLGFFFVVISLIGGTFWQLIGDAGTSNGLEGLELFIFHNFAMIFFISAILGTMSYFVFGGSR